MANLCPCTVGLLVRSSPLSQKLSSERERATEGSEMIATPDVTQEAVSELREEIQIGTEEKAGRRWQWCRWRLAVPILMCVHWTGNGHTGSCWQLDVPCSGAYHKGHEGMEWEGKTSGQRMHTLGETMFHQFFCPLSNLLTFGVSAPQ